MPEVGADFYALAGAGIITLRRAQRWTEELTFILQHEAAHGFQIQLTCPGGRDRARLPRQQRRLGPRKWHGRRHRLLRASRRALTPCCLSISITKRPSDRHGAGIHRSARLGTTGSAVQGDVGPGSRLFQGRLRRHPRQDRRRGHERTSPARNHPPNARGHEGVRCAASASTPSRRRWSTSWR